MDQKKHDKIIDIISDLLAINKERLIGEANFADDLGADSLDTVEMVMKIEDEFKIEILDEDLERIITVQQLLDYLDTKI